MSTKPSTTDEALSALMRVLDANKQVEWRTISFDDPTLLASLSWQAVEAERAALVPLLRAYQRVLRVLPAGEEHRALPMLEAGLHSAIQIADLARDEFLRRWGALFPGEDALGLVVHRAALGRRGELLLHHINEVQRNEPHYRAARFK